MLSTIGRSAIRRIGGGAPTSTNRALQSLFYLQRAQSIQTPESPSSLHQFASALQRCYATATNTATKSKTTKTKSSTASPKAKSTRGRPTKAKAKAKKPAKKKKPAAKRKVAAKKKPVRKPKKKVLTDEQKLRAEIKELKVKALLVEEPKSTATSAWGVLVADESKTGTSVATTIKSTASKYKSLSPSELEVLNHTANQNKANFDAKYKKWVESHSAADIKVANNARRLLRRRTNSERKYRLIRDDRNPKRPMTALLFFTTERHASGDLKGVGNFAETTKLVTEEWKALTASQRQQYEDKAKADKNRYIQEYKTVFGRDSTAKPA